MVKYLVLGSSGVIGQELVRYIRDQGHQVIEFDLVNSTSEDLRIANNETLDQVMYECNFCFFLACDIGGSRYLSTNQYSFDFLHNNTLILANTFNSLKRHNKPFIFSSSQMSSMTHSSYGNVKRLGEQYTRSLNGISARFWNVYGPEPVDEKSHAITDFIQKATISNSIQMFTDGKESRQFLYVSDAAKGLYELSQHYANLNPDNYYDITNFQWTSIKEVANIVASFYPGCRVIPGTQTDLIQQGIKNEPHKNILEFWKPTVNLQEGIANIIEANK